MSQNVHDEMVAALRALVAATESVTVTAADHDTLEDELDSLLTLGDAIDKARAVLARVAAR